MKRESIYINKKYKILYEHGFFGRTGGHSCGNLSSLNVGTDKDDSEDNVSKNKSLIAKSLGFEKKDIVTLKQQHTNICHKVDEKFKQNFSHELLGSRDRIVGDALATNIRGVLLGVKTADCVPVLFADNYNQVVGAAHAGWRGALSGVLENTVAAMVDLGAKFENIVVAIGPCIWAESYEVGLDLKQQFESESPLACEEFFRIKDTNGIAPCKWMFDLPGYVYKRLNKLGIDEISPSPFNTFENPDKFFSYRYNTVHGLGINGVQLSAIGML